MSNISLREYVRKIENQIENVQVDQAIDHCKHLLRMFPKHIESYRLLGKALLEKQKYTDSSDIFQRVLSSLPDDFISHIGMSIIREDENNLDAAIWHMERAFEVQPSNKAVQDELRRLYTKRDGVAPPKIRLTRGALVRMYTRGELYNQAIAEISAALLEDPNRVDLEVILAKIYFILGQKVEATETCSKLISKLPYCFEANKILSEVLVGTSREEDIKVFKQRVIDLDPYHQFIDDNYLSSADVPESNIMVDYLEWDPTLSQTNQPDWAQSIGFSFDSMEDDKEEISNWLDDSIFKDDGSTEEKAFSTFDSETEEEITKDQLEDLMESSENGTDLEPTESIMEDKEMEGIAESKIIEDTNAEEESQSIPDWIKDAGWEASTSEDENLQKVFNVPEDFSDDVVTNIESSLIEDEEEEIEPAEMPSWLKDIAPTDYQPDDEEDDDEIGLKNLEELFTEIDNKNVHVSQEDDTLQWENEFSEDEFSPDSTLSALQSEDQIESLSTEETLEGSSEESDLNQEEDDLDWIKNISFVDDGEEASDDRGEENQIFTEEGETEAEFNSELLSEMVGEVSSENQDQDAADEDDGWLSSLLETSDQPIPDKTEDEDVPEWIRSVAEEDISDQNDKLENIEEMPDWMNIAEESMNDEAEDIKIIFDESDEQLFSEAIESDSNSEEDLIKNIEDEPLSEKQEQSLNLSDQDDELTVEESAELLEIEDEEEIFANESLKILEYQAIANDLQKEDRDSPDETILFTEDDEESVKIEQHEDQASEALSLEAENSDLESTLSWIDELSIKQDEEELEPEISNAPNDFSSNWVDQNDNTPEDETESTPGWLKELEIETGDEIFEESVSNQVGEELAEPITEQEFISEPETNADFTEFEEEEQEQVPPSDSQLEVVDETFLSEELETDVFVDGEAEPEELPNQEKLAIESATEEEEDEILEPESYPQVNLVGEEQEISITKEEVYEESADIPEEIEDTQPIKVISETNINFDEAKSLLFNGKIDQSISIFNELIHQGKDLDEIIINIQNALDNYYPIDVNLWQVLGDAFLKNNQLQNALDAYSKAEDLLL